MSDGWYQAAIRRLCDSAGIAEWEAVVAIRQIEAGGYPVALFPEPDGERALGVYVELTNRAVTDAALLHRLLEANIGGAGGGFCLIPGADRIAFRSRVANADRLSGPALMSCILDLAMRAGTSLREALHTDTAPVPRGRRAAPAGRETQA
ncbi:MAG TPA: hypothetical protein VM406_05240 [Noviherbaspirillum sp.]|nr:hypothetical protein [Noviherbaspirillum sp.]